MECIDLRRRYDRQKTLRYNIEGTWWYIERFVNPFNGRFFTPYQSELEIDWRKREIYDSTAIMANQNLASSIHSGLTNPSIRWFEFAIRDRQINMRPDVQEWLTYSADQVFYALQESNFNLEATDSYLDITSFGTSVMVQEVVEQNGFLKEIDFQSTPVPECYFEQDYKGDILYFYRRLQWTPVQIVSKFGVANTPIDIVRKAEGGEGADQKEEVIFAIYPRKNIVGDVDTFSILPPNRRPFGWKYFTYKDSQMLGDEGGYYEMPAYVPRWRKTTGSMWGHSPAMICLSDILTLNQMVELILKSAEKVIDPATLTTRRGVFGDIDLEAGGVTVVQTLDSLKAFESGARFDVSQLQKSELQQNIRSAFYMDQLQLKESPAMTAAEVYARFQLMSRMMGPNISRLQYDFLDPLVKRTFKILFRYRMIPQPPDILLEQPVEMDVEYLGPMARSQKNDTKDAIERWVMAIQGMSQSYPQARDLIAVDETGRELATLGGVPPHLVNSQAKINAQRQANARNLQEQRQLAAATQGAAAMKTASEGQLAGAKAEAINAG